jgi:hypothetical protein
VRRAGSRAWRQVRGRVPSWRGRQDPGPWASSPPDAPIHCALEVTVDLLAITVFGIKFSGTLALEIGVVVLIVIGLVWFTTMRQRRR